MATPSSTATAIVEGIETARLLVQIVSRSFYSTKQSIVLDQLIRKEAMRDDELAGRTGMATKDLTKILHILLKDQLVTVHRRLELKEGAPKAQMRTYYYMDYSHATDIIKWRMYKVQNVIDHKLRNELHAQGYLCPRCKAAFRTLDASFLIDPVRGIFVCDSPGCNTELVDNENAEEVQGSKDRMQRLIVQTTTIRDLLKKMSNVLLPRFDVAKWLVVNGPLGTAVATGSGKSASVKIEIAGDDDEAMMKAKREADAEEKRVQNQLPSWIAQSTVSGEATAAHLDSLAKGSGFSIVSQHPASGTLDSKMDAASTAAATDLDDYYATLERTHSLATAASVPPSPLFSPIATPKIETTSDEEVDAVPAEDVIKMSQHRRDGSTGSAGKRNRDEVDSGYGEVNAETKKLRLTDPSPERDEKPVIFDRLENIDIAMLAKEMGDEDDDDDFEEVDDEDSNPMISVAGKLLPYNEVKADDDLSATMTSDEYTAYWDIFMRLG